MFFTFNTFMIALKLGLVFGLVETTFPFAYEALRGFYIKKHFLRYSNVWFRLVAVAIKMLTVYMPLQWDVSVFLVFPIALFAYLGLQIIADDYLLKVIK